MFTMESKYESNYLKNFTKFMWKLMTSDTSRSWKMYEHNLTVFGLLFFFVFGSSVTNSLVLVCDLATFWYQRDPHRIKHKKNLMQSGPQRMLSPVSVACEERKMNKRKGGKNSRAKNWGRDGEQWGASLLWPPLFVLNLLPPFVVAEIWLLSQSLTDSL